MDAFIGQMTKDVVNKYLDNNILIVNVPKNMTQFYQPLDLTVNGFCKSSQIGIHRKFRNNSRQIFH